MPELTDLWSPIRLSLQVGLWCTVIGFPFAAGAGWLLARVRFVGKTVVTTVLLLPLVLPPVVTGFCLLWLFRRTSPLGQMLGSLGVTIPFTVSGAVVAALVVGFPLYVLSARLAFETVDPHYEEISWTLGWRPRQTFLRVTLPLALPGMIAGALLAFARALGEFGATIVLAGNISGHTRTIPLAVYTLLESPNGERAAMVLIGASILISLVALFAYEQGNRMQRRRLELHYGR